ncbi:MAG TPA: hypothetical protein VGG02_06030 [Chthoniobacterales bacterium]|jgi:hypothetical protein
MFSDRRNFLPNDAPVGMGESHWRPCDLATALTLWFSAAISPWLGITVGLTVLVLFHLVYASRFILVLPHIAILIACLQYVFGAWVNFYCPPGDPTYDIGARFSIYLSYAGPLLIALTIGWAFGLVRLQARNQLFPTASGGLLFELDLLLGVGMLSFFAARLVHVESLAFVFLLLGNLRYIGVFGRMLLRGSGWQWRLAIVLGGEVFLAAGSTMFHDLLLWSAWTFAVWIYAFKPKPAIVLSMIAVAVLSLPALQEAKWRMRETLIDDDPLEENESMSSTSLPLAQVTAWLSYLIQRLNIR